MASQAMLRLGECVYFGMLSSSTTYRICSSASYTMHYISTKADMHEGWRRLCIPIRHRTTM